MARVVLGLGSNLGDRLGNLRNALGMLEPFYQPKSLRISSIWETEPIDCPEGSPSFLNCVIEFETDLLPEDLLRKTQEIELALGRPEEREVNSPRPVDLDMLLYGDLQISTPHLTVPHPRMMRRAFVLCPLAELRSEFEDAARRCNQPGITPLKEALHQGSKR